MLAVNQLNFSYQAESPTIIDVSFEIRQGEQVALIGESGCGKSSLLHLIFGNLQPNSGSISWNNTPIKGPLYKLIPGEEDVKILTQEFDLMPFISVEENITKHLSRMYPEENKAICSRLLKVVDLEGFEKRKVKNLSGGQKQRVAIAQCLAKQPKLLLMDEPFSHIDQFKKNKLRRRLFSFLKKEKITCIYATHDAKDMLHFADRTMVMSQGKIIDFRSPKELYNHPKQELVASLFEEVNRVNHQLISEKVAAGSYLYYPNEIKLSQHPTPVEAEVVEVYFNGSNFMIEVEVNEYQFLLLHESLLDIGETVFLSFERISFEERRLEN